jgi:hypothetical protein
MGSSSTDFSPWGSIGPCRNFGFEQHIRFKCPVDRDFSAQPGLADRTPQTEVCATFSYFEFAGSRPLFLIAP